MLLPTTTGAGHFSADNFTSKEPSRPLSLDDKQGVNTRQQYQQSNQTSAYYVEISQQQARQQYTYSYLNHSSLYTGPANTTPNLEQTAEVAPVNEASPLLDGAKNILTFIEHRIAAEKAAGASDKELEELLQQGLTGFQQGYSEALDILSGFGELNDIVNETVTTLYQQVIDGVDDLRQTYFSATPSNNDQATLTQPANDDNLQGVLSSNEKSDTLNNVFKTFANQQTDTLLSLIGNLDAMETAVDYTRKDSFAFELTTTDGDRISIQANQQHSFQGNYNLENHQNPINTEMSESHINHYQFTFTIEGELDEQEMVAIEDLLNQVMSLADDFYQGDIESAYQAALELGYNQDEITQYSLNLKQVETYQAAATYQQFEPALLNRTPENQDIFNRIGTYAQSLLETLNNPNNYQFFDYSQLLNNIAEQIEQQIQPSDTQGFYSLIDKLST